MYFHFGSYYWCSWNFVFTSFEARVAQHYFFCARKNVKCYLLISFSKDHIYFLISPKRPSFFKEYSNSKQAKGIVFGHSWVSHCDFTRIIFALIVNCAAGISYFIGFHLRPPFQRWFYNYCLACESFNDIYRQSFRGMLLRHLQWVWLDSRVRWFHLGLRYLKLIVSTQRMMHQPHCCIYF